MSLRAHPGTPSPRGADPGGTRPAVVAIGLALLAFGATAAVCAWYNAEFGIRHLYLGTAAPVAGTLELRTGMPTLVAVGVAAVLGCGMPRAAETAPWRRLLLISVAAGAAWVLALTWIDGSHSLEVLGRSGEYLVEIPRVDDGAFLATFTDHIRWGSPDFHWATHVAAHPPGALLAFFGLDRIGLAGPAWAGAVSAAVAVSASAAALIAARAVAGEAVARAAAPFVGLAPAVLWVAASADALFTGVAAWSVALLAVAARRRDRGGDLAAVGGGLLAGLLPYLSYGLVLFFPVAAAVVLAQHRIRPLLIAAVPVLLVAVAFTAGGFWWLEGLEVLRERYYQGVASRRPYPLFVVANLAVLALVVGPACLAGLTRLRRAGRAAVLPATAGACLLVANLSGMSKSEVERIWLPWTPWLLLATALLPAARRRRWLAAQLLLALAFATAVRTSW